MHISWQSLILIWHSTFGVLAMTSFCEEKCCHLVSGHEAFAVHLYSSVCHFLICMTLVLVTYWLSCVNAPGDGRCSSVTQGPRINHTLLVSSDYQWRRWSYNSPSWSSSAPASASVSCQCQQAVLVSGPPGCYRSACRLSGELSAWYERRDVTCWWWSVESR